MTTRRTVLLVLADLRVGGAELQVVQLAEGLERHGWRPVFATLFPGGQLAERVRRAGIPIHALCARMCYPKWDPRFYIDAFRTVNRLRRVIAREKATIVHGFLFWPSIYAALASRLSRSRACVTSRRSLGITKQGRGGYQALENFTNRLVRAVTGNSMGVYEEILARERVARERVCVIYNGVDLSAATACEPTPLRERFPQLANANPIVLGVGNLRRVKGFEDLLEAVAIARRDVPTMGLMIVGQERELTRASLEERARALGIADVLAVATDCDDPRPYYRAADVLCQSSHSEGFPNVVLEAMAAGLPIVATDVGGTREAVRDAETGMLVPPRRPELIAARLVELARDEARRHAMGEAALRFAESRFSLDAMVAAHARLYESLATSGRLPAMAHPPVLEAAP